MSTISTEQAKDLRNAFECWQQDYDPVEDKEQYEMFGLGVVAMDELLALRKERERAEPVVNDERYQKLSESYHAQEKRLFKLAQRIKGPSFDKYAHSPSQAIDVLEVAIFGENDDACRAAMPNQSQPVSEADTTSQQFESLAGKAVVTDEKGNLPCPFCGGRCDPNGWMGSYDDGVPMCGPECEDCGATASSIEEWNRRSTALAGKAVVPEGWKLVPVEPTLEMQIAFAEAWFSKVRCVDDCELEDAYIAMLSAAPEPCK
ncbi:hypothetical protein [Cronobacter sakazakii]|uniref:hypothetical protein n=1 Tax=Cronobacter sakazakii TaxID=28141 RepID=UPI00192A2236|nr:hypothetical protein [Cronobacter sakazakii]